MELGVESLKKEMLPACLHFKTYLQQFNYKALRLQLSQYCTRNTIYHV